MNAEEIPEKKVFEQPKELVKPTLVGLPIPTDVTAVPKTGVNINEVGTHNGVEITNFDLDSLEDKPWRKPGADITDYFNFGFTEDSWRAYCNKQRQLRDENSKKRTNVYFLLIRLLIIPNKILALILI